MPEIAAEIDLRLTVNGEAVRARVPAGRHLIDVLRLDFGLSGAHAGCEHGVCGACTLRVNGQIVRGCLMLAAQAEGAEVWTVEGLTDSGAIADLQQAFVARNALQCGFCTPGMLATAADLLDRGGIPSRDEIREHISGNYCRCTGYEAIVDAIETVARARAQGAAA
jgi:carbon-monoxide dehydrogenase small subunit